MALQRVRHDLATKPTPPCMHTHTHTHIYTHIHYIDTYTHTHTHIYIVVQLLSHVRLFVTPWTATRQASLSFIISQSLLKFMSVELVMLSNHLLLCHPLLLLPSIFPNMRYFTMRQFSLHQVAKVLELQLLGAL